MNTKEQKQIGLLDIFKFLASILVVGSHVLPIFDEPIFNFYYGQWFFRWCVPLFFISSGYFFSGSSLEKKKKQIKHIVILYIFSLMIYFPNIVGVTFTLGLKGWFYILYEGVFIGYFHLWYLSALLVGLLVWYLVSRFFNNVKVLNKYTLVIIVGLVIIGAFFDEYHYFFNGTWIEVGQKIVNRFGGSRHAIFFAIPMLLIGREIRRNQSLLLNIKKKWYILLLIFTGILSYGECSFLLKTIGEGITNDVSLFGYLPAVILFIIAMISQLQIPQRLGLHLRKMSEYIYVLHPLIYRNIMDNMGISGFHLLVLTVLLCIIIYLTMYKISHKS